jgi:hypothetical protein
VVSNTGDNTNDNGGSGNDNNGDEEGPGIVPGLNPNLPEPTEPEPSEPSQPTDPNSIIYHCEDIGVHTSTRLRTISFITMSNNTRSNSMLLEKQHLERD